LANVPLAGLSRYETSLQRQLSALLNEGKCWAAMSNERIFVSPELLVMFFAGNPLK
jgi:hypothetical protein